MFLPKRSRAKTEISRRKKNFTMTTLIKRHTLQISRAVIMFGSITFARFGCLNVTSRKRMGSSMYGAFKTLRKNVTNMNASSVKNPEQAPVSNAKILNVKSTIILNVRERKRYIWSSSTYKKSSISFSAKSMNLLKLQGKSSTKRRKIEIKSSSSREWLKSTLKPTKLRYSLSSLWKSFPPNLLFKLSKTMKKKKRKTRSLKLSNKQMKTLSKKSSSNSQRLKRFLSPL